MLFLVKNARMNGPEPINFIFFANGRDRCCSGWCWTQKLGGSPQGWHSIVEGMRCCFYRSGTCSALLKRA
jgi:hypothetical protein